MAIKVLRGLPDFDPDLRDERLVAFHREAELLAGRRFQCAIHESATRRQFEGTGDGKRTWHSWRGLERG